jgi:hypothetical protein
LLHGDLETMDLVYKMVPDLDILVAVELRVVLLVAPASLVSNPFGYPREFEFPMTYCPVYAN